MRRLTLYIAGKRADLDDASFLLMNWTQDEASSPATVRNSYSQTVTLPATPANNAIFGYFWRPDRVTPDGGFDPLAQTPFDLVAETGDRVSGGYLKLDSIATGPGGVASYSVTLYGGLGGFFYAMTNRTDGQKRSLADMTWLVPGSEDDPLVPEQEPVSLTAETVRSAWNAIDPEFTGTKYPIYRLLNFAPCLNGIPTEGFDAKHAVYKAPSSALPGDKGYIGLYVTKMADGVEYSAKVDSTILLNLPESATEWEAQDLRAYLQRPVLNLRQFLRSVAYSSKDTGYELVLDSTTFGGSDKWIDDVWLTLPLFDRKSFDPAEATLAQLLKGTPSPAEVLISVAKAMGWVFVYDDGQATVTLMDRERYYSGGGDAVDLEGRLAGEVTIRPNLMDRRFYTFGAKEVPGAFAKQYDETYGVQYGAQRVNTGYGFSDEDTEAMSGTALRGAADVLDVDGLYFIAGREFTTGQGSDRIEYQLKFAYKGGVSWLLYASSGKTLDCKASGDTAPQYHYYDEAVPGRHFAVLPQFCGDDRKAEDGSMALLFLDSFAVTPSYEEGAVSVRLHLSNDTATMLDLNDGVPCWDVTLEPSADIVEITRFPSFRRWKVNDADAATEGVPVLDFGVPQVVGFPEPPAKTVTLYGRSGWNAYVADRFDRDTKVLTARVDLSGLEVGGALLRRFYRWGGCVWSLNKIINYSLTTDDLTECEFVQVKDKSNYTG